MTNETGLARIIREQGRTVTWIATRSGVSISLVSLWKDGKRRIPPAKRGALADLLGVEEEELR